MLVATLGCNVDRPLGAVGGPPADLGARDLAGGGSALDLASVVDASTPRDLASASDLATPRDLAVPIDLSSPRDLTLAPDLQGPTWAGDAVAYQIDPQHRGAQLAGLTPPLTRKWSVGGSGISYPLIAGGRVYVTLLLAQTGNRAQLLALDGATGAIVWGPVDLGATAWANAAYDGGRVIAVNEAGLLSAYDGAAGTKLWSVQLGGSFAYSSPPTAAGGIVYVAGNSALAAIDETNGNFVWSANVSFALDSSPVVSDTAVYVSYVCDAYAFTPPTGALLWHHNSGCSGAGGLTAVLYGDSLYARNPVAYNNTILAASTGSPLGTFSASPIPAFDRGLGFLVGGSGIVAQDLASGAWTWTFADSDGSALTAPIVVDGRVYVGSTGGTLFALDAVTGQELWSDSLGASVPYPDEFNAATPLTGLGAANGLLIVPTKTALIAYSN
jgi:outer membrane protein assembly factor BamB